MLCLRNCFPHTQDYFDQSLDEIKLLRYVNNSDPEDEHHIVRLYDFFYYKVRPGVRGFGGLGSGFRWCASAGFLPGFRGGLAPTTDPDGEHHILRLYDFVPLCGCLQEHLILVCELLRANLYEFQKYQRENGDDPYFTLPRIQRIAIQVC